MREDFQEQRMTEAAVDNVGLEYPGLEAGEACLDFGNHSAVNDAFGDQLAAFLGSETPDQACRVHPYREEFRARR